jgi:hypothetical protein
MKDPAGFETSDWSSKCIAKKKHEHLKMCKECGNIGTVFERMLDYIADELLLWN